MGWVGGRGFVAWVRVVEGWGLEERFFGGRGGLDLAIFFPSENGVRGEMEW